MRKPFLTRVRDIAPSTATAVAWITDLVRLDPDKWSTGQVGAGLRSLRNAEIRNSDFRGGLQVVAEKYLGRV